MNKGEAQEKLSAFIDGTLPATDAAQLRELLEENAELRAEFETMKTLRAQMQEELSPPAVSEEEWDQIALCVVSKHSQRLGWTLLTPGAASLVVGLFAVFLLTSEVPLWERVAVGAIVAGLAFLLMSAIADRVRAMRCERYDKVDR